jgi:hypothetical protein
LNAGFARGGGCEEGGEDLFTNASSGPSSRWNASFQRRRCASVRRAPALIEIATLVGPFGVPDWRTKKTSGEKRGRAGAPRGPPATCSRRGCAPVSTRMRQGQPSRPFRDPSCARESRGSGGEASRMLSGLHVVTADLDTSEPLAARLRRCDGDSGPQRAHSSRSRGECLHSGSPVPQGSRVLPAPS